MIYMNRYIFVYCVFLIFSFGCNEKPVKKNDKLDRSPDSSLIIEKGKEITSSTFLALSSELQSAMKSGGIDHALAYCNTNALDITDSLSNIYNASIKRTSFKYRNPKNAPTDQEKEMLGHFEKVKKEGGLMSPQVISKKNINTFYSPIIVQDMCLKCHGPKDEIANYQAIKNLYPDDMAFDYKQGDLRGIWSVEFKQ